MSENQNFGAGKKPDRQGPELSLAEAKRNFIKACSVYEPLGVVKRHPFTAPLCAMLAGYAFTRLMKPVAGLATLPLAMQAAQLATKFILALRKK